VTLGWTVAAEAQQQPQPAIGLLSAVKLPDGVMNAIRAGLSETGYVESRNLTIISHSAEGGKRRNRITRKKCWTKESDR
jgi:hypothetical protein